MHARYVIVVLLSKIRVQNYAGSGIKKGLL